MLRSGTITRQDGLPEQPPMELSFALSSKRNFDRLDRFDSFQTQLAEPPKHLFLRTSFCSRYNIISRRQEADGRSKSKYSSEHSSKIDAILSKAAKWWMSLVNALLLFDELYCPFDQSGVAVAGATNAVNTRRSEAVTLSIFTFSAPSPPHC